MANGIKRFFEYLKWKRLQIMAITVANHYYKKGRR